MELTQSANCPMKLSDAIANSLISGGTRALTIDSSPSSASRGSSPLSSLPATASLATPSGPTEDHPTPSRCVSDNAARNSSENEQITSLHYVSRPLRERRLPASFWQEPNVPRTRRTSASNEHHSVSWTGNCCETAVKCKATAGVCCFGGCTAPSDGAANSDATLYPLHLLHYFGIPSSSYHLESHQQPHVISPPSAIDLAALYLSGLYPNSQQQPHQQQQLLMQLKHSSSTMTTAAVQNLAVADETPSYRIQQFPETRQQPPTYESHRNHHHHHHHLRPGNVDSPIKMMEKRIPLPLSPTTMLPDELVIAKFVANNRIHIDGLPMASVAPTWPTPAACDNGQDTAKGIGCVGDYSPSNRQCVSIGGTFFSGSNRSTNKNGMPPTSCVSDDRREPPAILRESTAAVALAAAYLHQQRGGSWVMRGTDKSALSSALTDIGRATVAEQRRCLGDLRSNDTSNRLQGLLRPASIPSTYGAPSSLRCGLFPVWRSSEEAVVGSPTGDYLRNAHRYHPY